MFQNAGEKRRPARRRGGPAEASSQPGGGPRDLGEGPSAGVRGRSGGRAGGRGCTSNTGPIERRWSGWSAARAARGRWSTATSGGAMRHLAEMGRGHATVCHTVGEWARDDDGDGIREVHDNTLEGMWTGLRNHLRTFRGVNKEYLHQYVAIFEWTLQCEAGHARIPPSTLGRPASHHFPDMSQSSLTHDLFRVHPAEAYAASARTQIDARE